MSRFGLDGRTCILSDPQRHVPLPPQPAHPPRLARQIRPQIVFEFDCVVSRLAIRPLRSNRWLDGQVTFEIARLSCGVGG